MTQYNRFMGEYSDNTDYEKGDVVVFDGAAYYRKMPGKGISPIARKKPYLVWSRLNENLSTVFPLGGGPGGGNTGGGTPYQYLVTDGDGNTGWADRLAWKEGETKTLLDNETVTIVDSGMAELPGIEIVSGNTYTVTLNGETYERVAAAATMQGEGFPLAYIGNPQGIGVSDVSNGDPFTIASASGQTVITCSASGTYTLGITEYAETVHPIPDEFLPMEIVFTMIDETHVSCNFSSLVVSAAASEKKRFDAFLDVLDTTKTRLRLLYTTMGKTGMAFWFLYVRSDGGVVVFEVLADDTIEGFELDKHIIHSVTE